jgi:hypothetical protein
MVKPNGKNRMNVCASPHPRQVQRVPRGSFGTASESPFQPAIERFSATPSAAPDTPIKTIIL